MMFLHQGQDELKKLRFHPIYDQLVITTASSGFNLFNPYLDHEDSEDSKNQNEFELDLIPDQVTEEELQNMN